MPNENGGSFKRNFRNFRSTSNIFYSFFFVGIFNFQQKYVNVQVFG